MRLDQFIFSAVGLFSLSACSMTRPCTEAGDLDHIPKVKGDKVCYQREQPDGKFANHGAYIQRHMNGKIAVEGQFEDGRKVGYWHFYDDKGKKYAERFFTESGVEIIGPRPPDKDFEKSLIDAPKPVVDMGPPPEHKAKAY
jgi:hypothetical protein